MSAALAVQNKGFGLSLIFIVLFGVVSDGDDQVFNIAKDAAAQAFFCQVAEENRQTALGTIQGLNLTLFIGA
jgi:hypothetical protein